MRFFVMLIVSCAFPFVVAAHGSGASLERTADGYLIDIGYDPMIIYEDDRVVFDFTDLFDAASVSAQATTTVDFDYVWVRLRDGDGGTLLATGIRRADFGPTSLLYAIPEKVGGDLQLYVRYQNGDETVVETDFVIPVEPYDKPYWWVPLAGSAAAGALGALMIAGVAFFFFRRRNVHNSLVRE